MGPVRVIRRDNNWASVEPGEMITCSMTTPDVVMVIERNAEAFSLIYDRVK